MSDTRIKTATGQWRDALGTIDGRMATVQGGIQKIYTTTGAAAISKTTTLKTDFPGREWILKRISVTFSTAPTTAGNLTVTQNSSNSPGTRPDTVIFSQDPSATSATSILQIWEEGGLRLPPLDEVTLAYTNTDTRTVTAEIIVEVI